MNTNPKAQTGFFIALLAIVILLTFLILKPYLSALFLAIIFAISFRPVYEWILRACGERKTIAALSTVGVLVLLIVIPLTSFSFFIFKDAETFYYRLAQDTTEGGPLAQGIAYLEALVQKIVPNASINVVSYVQQGLELLVQNLGALFGKLFTLGLGLFLMLLGVFYFLRDGGKFREYFIFLSPLSDAYDKTILGRLETAIGSVVKGALSIALIQGILSGIGFAIFGIPSPMLWGAIAAIAALIPGVGTALVLFPAICFLFFFGSKLAALGLLIWGVIAVGLVDNILGPLLIERGLKIHPFLILLSVLGGIAFFGPVGFLAGPVTIALLFALFEIYPLISSRH